jgi:hypothetical protein
MWIEGTDKLCVKTGSSLGGKWYLAQVARLGLFQPSVMVNWIVAVGIWQTRWRQRRLHKLLGAEALNMNMNMKWTKRKEWDKNIESGRTTAENGRKAC